jgi:hypothetical protein
MKFKLAVFTIGLLMIATSVFSADTKGSNLSSAGTLVPGSDKLYVIDATGPSSKADTITAVVSAGVGTINGVVCGNGTTMAACTASQLTYRWNNGGKTILLPTTSDDYSHFRAFTSRTLSDAKMMVVGGTSVAATLMKCSNVMGSCVAISDSLTVNAGAEGTFLAVGASALSQALVAGDRVQVDITAVNGAVTSVTVDLGGTVP